MICVDYPCDKCIHKRPNIEGWKCACDAFPEGIPNEIIFESDPRKMKECNNGIGYKEKEQSSTN